MRLTTLDQWLDWQLDLHDKTIALGLERVQQVATRLGIGKIANKVITVAGTNGKGSSVAAYEHWLVQAGFTVASYTSPHLLQYNERIKYNLAPVDDAELCDAFAAIAAVRQETPLTFFEFGSLAAFYLMQKWRPDYAILEVGLGGRLDAVNLIDADLVHLTPIGIDHQAWLGDDREAIGFEKAGVLRAEVPVVLNDPDPPQSVLTQIEKLHCKCLLLERDYHIEAVANDQLLWRSEEWQLMLDPILSGAHQAQNLAGVVAGLSQLIAPQDYQPSQWRDNFHGTQLAGRFQQLTSPFTGRLLVDVGHNPDAAAALARNLTGMQRSGGKIVVLLGMLDDKQPELFVKALRAVVDHWWLLTLTGARGLSAAELQARIGPQIEVEHLFDELPLAMEQALSSLGNEDIMLVTGSFLTVELLLRAIADAQYPLQAN